ncbi:MAG: 3-hydroxyacyl-CoA dehydrogenase family protein, partial [Calditrichaeota bacterium]|nr:3-hydroxyacyl-CoA dehydrogenase family protein [Calditrichota bacterium]
MTLNERLQNVAVLGAGGKMGSGISLLLAREMALQKLNPDNAGKSYRITLMDIDPAALDGLQNYLRRQAQKYAQKNAAALPGGSSETDFVDTMMSLLHPVTSLEKVGGARMVFEAILEKLDLKVKVFNQLKSTCAPDTYFFSNTSSIPLKELDEQVGLDGRIIGFHFYNPPAVQRLVELIIPERVQPELPALSRELGKRLGKIIIPSNDVAGFIG